MIPNWLRLEQHFNFIPRTFPQPMSHRVYQSSRVWKSLPMSVPPKIDGQLNIWIDAVDTAEADLFRANFDFEWNVIWTIANAVCISGSHFPGNCIFSFPLRRPLRNLAEETERWFIREWKTDIFLYLSENCLRRMRLLACIDRFGHASTANAHTKRKGKERGKKREFMTVSAQWVFDNIPSPDTCCAINFEFASEKRFSTAKSCLHSVFGATTTSALRARTALFTFHSIFGQINYTNGTNLLLIISYNFFSRNFQLVGTERSGAARRLKLFVSVQAAAARTSAEGRRCGAQGEQLFA